jgi:1L-myo-inositol 1-phosphate cytidylyltransferase / CDP-L-myo-inositol myo-inositolphosphotransferase
MVGVAVLVMSEGEEMSPLTKIGGVTLLKRAVLTVQKVGVTTCYLYVAHVTDALRHEVHDDARVTSRIVWVSPTLDDPHIPEPLVTEPSVVFSVTMIVRHPLLQTITQETTAENTTVFTDASGAAVIAVVPGAQVPTLLRELQQGQRLVDSSTITSGERKRLPRARALFFHRLTPASRIAEVEQALLLSLENPRDGQVDTHLNRKLSRPLTRWLLHTLLTPNQITLLSCVVGLVGALCFFPGGYWGPVLGAVLLQFSVVLDCCDGEVARVKFLESPFGDVLDIVCDTLVTIAIFVGMGVAVWQDGASSHALPLASMLVLGGCLAFPLVTLAEKTEALGEQRGGWEDGLMKRLIASLTTRDVSIVIFASALTGKLLWFLWGAAIGAQIFWLILLWLLWRAGRLQHWMQGVEVKK